MSFDQKIPCEACTVENGFIFVSYSHKDRTSVYPLIKKLYDDQFLLWYDEGIPPSEIWLKTIASKIRSCACFLVFLSKNAIQSGNVFNEVTYALKRYYQREIKFIPIYLERTDLPPEWDLSLHNIQALLKYAIEDAVFYKKLTEALPLETKVRKAAEEHKREERKVKTISDTSKIDELLEKQEMVAEGIRLEEEKRSLVEEKRRTKSDKEILKELEQLIGKSISAVATISLDTVGMKFEGDVLVELGLYHCGLTALPKSFSELKSLQSLHLSFNKLWSLPESFGNLTSLQKLYLNKNWLKTLPKSFGELKSLQSLYISSNKLLTLPESFGTLKSLKDLYLSHNLIMTFPEAILQLKSLQKLDLSYNKLTSLPGSILDLSALKRLDVAYNPLDSHAKEILKKLKKKRVMVDGFPLLDWRER